MDLPLQKENNNTDQGYKPLKKRKRYGEDIIQFSLYFCGIFSIFTTIGIVFEIGKESLLFFQNPGVDLWKFLTGIKWQPQAGEFGILPLVNSTLITTLFAMVIAIPLGLSIAIYLSEYASTKVCIFIKPVLEVLAGIPTVVYGYFALSFMTSLLRNVFGSDVVDIYNTASQGWSWEY